MKEQAPEDNSTRARFTAYLTEHHLRKTKERYAVLDAVTALASHFDIDSLHRRLTEAKYVVSKATLYNTLEVLLEAGIIIRHQFDSKAKAEYELKAKADTHMHLVCTTCGWTREIKINTHLKQNVHGLLKARFAPEYFSLCAYGLCNKCKKEQNKNNNTK